MRVQPLASTTTDNFMYLVIDEDEGLLVDPVDAPTAIRAVREAGLSTVRVLTTHGHPDHAGGNAAVRAALGCEVLASAHATTFPVEADRELSDGDRLQVGATTWDIVHAPGHTEGHIVAWHPGHLLSGDVLFVGGAGNCRFGGDPGHLYETFTRRLAAIPDETTFYPGHDYAVRNLQFALEIEPDNAQARQRLDAATRRSRADGPVLTTLGEERAYNPFHRTAEPRLQARLFERYPDLDPERPDPGERAFRILRRLRDAF